MHFILRSSPSTEKEFIISVSKKVSKKAVIRNLIKRRIRPILKKFDLKPARYLLIANPGAEKIRGVELQSELEKVLKIKG